MKTNEGMTDRVIRMFLGVVVSSFFIYHYSAWALIGIPIFVSGAVGICPLYSLLGINTLEKEEA